MNRGNNAEPRLQTQVPKGSPRQNRNTASEIERQEKEIMGG